MYSIPRGKYHFCSSSSSPSAHLLTLVGRLISVIVEATANVFIMNLFQGVRVMKY